MVNGPIGLTNARQAASAVKYGNPGETQYTGFITSYAVTGTDPSGNAVTARGTGVLVLSNN